MHGMRERSFHVAAAPSTVWRALIDAGTWPTWAAHLRRVEVTLQAPVGPSSTATLHMTNGSSAKVAVTEFDDGRRFRWEGSFLWATLRPPLRPHLDRAIPRLQAQLAGASTGGEGDGASHP